MAGDTLGAPHMTQFYRVMCGIFCHISIPVAAATDETAMYGVPRSYFRSYLHL